MVARCIGVLALMGLAACAPSGAGGPGSVDYDASAQGLGAEDAGACFDAATFTFRASCNYQVPVEAGLVAACDEWWQVGSSDWGTFIEGCTDKNGAVSVVPCGSGPVAECLFPASCTDQLRTYVFGGAAPALALECLETEGGTWTSM